MIVCCTTAVNKTSVTRRINQTRRRSMYIPLLSLCIILYIIVCVHAQTTLMVGYAPDVPGSPSYNSHQRFMNANPDISLNYTDFNKFGAFYNNMFGAISNFFKRQDDYVDVFMVDIIWTADLANHLVDLGPSYTSEEKAKFYKNILDSNTVNGKMVAAPWFFNGGLLLYRTDLLTKYGFSAPPETWDELEHMAETIQIGERKAGNPKFWGYMFDGKAAESLTCDTLEWLGSYRAGSIVESVDGKVKVTVNNPRSIRILERVRRWVGWISPETVITARESDAYALWATGNVAFMRNWPNAVRNTRNTNLASVFGVSALPGETPGTGKGTIGGWQLGINKYSKNIDAAIRFVKFMTSPAELKERALTGSYMPPMNEIITSPEVCNGAKSSFMCSVKWDLVARPSSITYPNYLKVSQIIYTMVNSIISGTISASKGVAMMERDLNDISGIPYHKSTWSQLLWRWLAPVLSLLIAGIVLSIVIWFVVFYAIQWRKKRRVQEFSVLVDEDGENTSAKGSARPSIRLSIVVIFIGLILLTVLCTWIPSYASGRKSVSNLQAQLHKSYLLRIKEAALNSVLQGIALGQGALTVDFAASSVATFLPTMDVTLNTRLAVFDRSGNVIAANGAKTFVNKPISQSKDRLMVKLGEYLIEKYGNFSDVKLSAKDQHSFKMNNEEVYIHGINVIDVSGVDWLIFIATPASDIIGDIQIGNIIAIIVSAMVVLISITFSMLFSFFITSPISKLVIDMQRVTHMDLSGIGKMRFSILKEVYSMQVVYLKMVEMLNEYKSYMPSNLFVDATEEEKEEQEPSVMDTPDHASVKNHSVGTKNHLDSMSDLTSMRGVSRLNRVCVDLSNKKFTVLIINIEGFNDLVNQVSPQDLIRIHADYIDAMTKVITMHRGTFDRFSADKITASFNTTIPSAKHSEQACKCALACQERMTHLQREWERCELPSINIRMGIASGSGLVGNIGTSNVRGFAILGFKVNVASTLEQHNRKFKTRILCDEAVYHSVHSNYVLRPVDVVDIEKLTSVKDYHPFTAYELVSGKVSLSEEWMYEMQNDARNNLYENYCKGFEEFVAGQFEESIMYFEAQLKQPETEKDHLTTLWLSVAREALVQQSIRPSLQEEWKYVTTL